MESLVFSLIWIFVMFLSPGRSSLITPGLQLERIVFVAFTGEELIINCSIVKPANQTVDTLTCSNPQNQRIYRTDIPQTSAVQEKFNRKIRLRTVSISGEYVCQYQTAMVFWLLLVRDDDFKEPMKETDYTEVIGVGVASVVLLLYSVAGSLYVFRGRWKEQVSDDGGNANRERATAEVEDDNDAEIVPAPPSSHYASLQPRQASVYDVIDRSAGNREQRNSEAKNTEKAQQNTTVKEDSVFESVYENF